jgi:hypothetical protein
MFVDWMENATEIFDLIATSVATIDAVKMVLNVAEWVAWFIAGFIDKIPA